MFWVFCNCCYIKPGAGKKRLFFMTSCSHILCSNCTRQDAETCEKCGAECMIVQCNAQMPDEVKEVFSDVNEKIPTLIKVLDFQEGHRAKLLDYYRSHFFEYQAAKAYITELEQKLNNIKHKYEACIVVLNKQQSNLEMLMKKYQWYKEKCGNMEAASKTFTSSQKAFPQSNASKRKLNSTFTSGRQSTAHMNLSHNFTPSSGRQLSKFTNIPDNRSNQCFTPMSGIQPLAPHTPVNTYRMNPNNCFLTPESEYSSHKSSNSSGSLSSSTTKRTFLGYTPPLKSLEHLSLTNKNWSKGK